MVGIFGAIRRRLGVHFYSEVGPDEDLSGRRGGTGRVCDDHDGRAMARGTTGTIVNGLRGNWQRGGTAGDDCWQESDAHEAVMNQGTGTVNSEWNKGTRRRGTRREDGCERFSCVSGSAQRPARLNKGEKEQGFLFLAQTRLPFSDCYVPPASFLHVAP